MRRTVAPNGTSDGMILTEEHLTKRYGGLVKGGQ